MCGAIAINDLEEQQCITQKRQLNLGVHVEKK